MGGFDEALGLKLVGEASLRHPLENFGEAGEEGDGAEVREGGGGPGFGEGYHERFFPLGREEGAVKGV